MTQPEFNFNKNHTDVQSITRFNILYVSVPCAISDIELLHYGAQLSAQENSYLISLKIM